MDAILERLPRHVRRIQGVSLLTLTSLIAALVSFLVNIITARALGPDGRGAVALVLQIAYILAPMGTFGFPRAKLRAGSSDRKVVGGGRFWLLLTLVMVAPLLAWSYGIWYMLAIPAAAVTASFQVLRSDAVVESKFSRYFWVFVSYQFSILAGTVILALSSVSVWQYWAGVYFVPSVAVLFVSFGRFRWALNPLVWIRTNWPFAVAELSNVVILRADRLALGFFSGSKALGLYVVVATALEPIYWVAQALADSRTVTVYRENRLKMLASNLLRETAFYGMAITVVGLGIWFTLVPVFGAEYESARPLVFPLAIASVFLVLYRQAAGIALVRGHSSKLGVSEAILSILAAALYIVFCSEYGALGAAWSSCIVYLIGFAVLLRVAFTSNELENVVASTRGI